MASVKVKSAEKYVEKRYLKKEVEYADIHDVGKYTPEALKGISPERTDKAVELIRKNGGKVISMYSVLGEKDLVFILDLLMLRELLQHLLLLTD